MNKKELVSAMAENSGVTIKDTEKTLNAFMETVKDTLASGDSVCLIGFGTFEPRFRAERTGHNPQTGETIKIAECIVPAFKAGKAFKEALN